jgi:hypothetical protein
VELLETGGAILVAGGNIRAASGAARGCIVGEDATVAIEAILVASGDKCAAHGAVLEALSAVL